MRWHITEDYGNCKKCFASCYNRGKDLVTRCERFKYEPNRCSTCGIVIPDELTKYFCDRCDNPLCLEHAQGTLFICKKCIEKGKENDEKE